MPELPEVTTVVRELKVAGLVDKTIKAIDLRFPRIFGDQPRKIYDAMLGNRVADVTRRGKFIVLDFADGTRILVHLRMTGKFRFVASLGEIGKHDHVVLSLDDDRHLVYNDTRKFGRFTLCSAMVNPLAKLGPEPLDKGFTLECFKKQLAGSARMLKPLLLDQSIVAGLGNIYVDEALWEARLHPERRADTLAPAEIKRLHKAIPKVLALGVANNGTTLGSGEANFYSVAGRRGRNADMLKVFRRHGLPCPRCETEIRRDIVAQRSTHYCQKCQEKKPSGL